jgi:hypothetical protein
MRKSLLFLVPSVTLLVSCSSNPQPAGPAPDPAPRPAAGAPAPTPTPATPAPAAPDLSGSWDFSVDAGGQVIPGEITLERSGAGYTGTVTPQGMSPATVRTLTLTGRRVTMLIDTPDGEATFEGTLGEDGRSLTGNVSFQGQTLPFTARKR